jgi:uncharacterized heparinase superfamily protein
MNRIRLLIDTVRYLRPVQIRYRIKYFLRSRLGKGKWNSKDFDESKNKSISLQFQESIKSHTSFHPEQSFEFLNVKYIFPNKIDWNFPKHGRLWTYNLNYFEFLHQEKISKKEGLALIEDFIETIGNNHTGLEPYPLSLRIINWIKFFAIHNIHVSKYNNVLRIQLKLLSKNKEYHLLGNHLLENGFALLFGAYFFHDANLYEQARIILKNELKEQTLNDGAHFELSPMYHQIMLYRLLDCINLISNNGWISDDLLSFMKEKAQRMSGWLRIISFKNGSIPFLNDTSGGIAPSTTDLMAYSERLEIYPPVFSLKECGYRKFENDDIECIFDAGAIGPMYQPGHAHADTFNVVLNIHGKQVLVDTGCSTYEAGDTRYYERGTKAHNTVVVNGLNSSEVWASHRVGQRAEVKLLEDTPSLVKASHSGYRSLGISHERSVEIKEENILSITDRLLSPKESSGIAYFHMDNQINDISIDDNTVVLKDCKITFQGATKIERHEYLQALEFNLQKPAKCIEVTFSNELVTEFII